MKYFKLTLATRAWNEETKFKMTGTKLLLNIS
jgi:hypothetical protein